MTIPTPLRRSSPELTHLPIPVAAVNVRLEADAIGHRLRERVTPM